MPKDEVVPLTWSKQAKRLLSVVIEGDLLPLCCQLCLDDNHADRLIRVVADAYIAAECLHDRPIQAVQHMLSDVLAGAIINHEHINVIVVPDQRSIRTRPGWPANRGTERCKEHANIDILCSQRNRPNAP